MILEDIGQKVGQHVAKNKYFINNADGVLRVPLPVGDYTICTEKSLDVIERKSKRGNELKKIDFLGTYSISVDTKKDIQELIGNVCGKAHARFRDECILAQNNDIKLFVLVENKDGIKKIEDLFRWNNPRLHRYNKINYMHNIGKWTSIPLPKGKPTSGSTLAKALLTMQLKYGVVFEFCKPEEAGRCVIKLLGGE